MKTVGIVGSGTMGAGIAQVAALSGKDVVVYDVSEDILKNAEARIASELQRGIEKGKLTSDQAEDAKKRIRPTVTLEQFSSCDVVIEAAVERLDVKKDIFRRVESVCPTETILATNTSSFSVTELSSAIKHPERLAGMHFFNPPHLMKLVEIIRGHTTSQQTIQHLLEFARELGKVPVVAKDTPGFIVNRVARPFYGEALRLLGEGIASAEDIDRIVRLEGGFRMGPFELMDLIGIDINFAVTQSIYEQTFGEARYRPHIIQKNMVAAGLLGRKTKKGFYRYDS